MSAFETPRPSKRLKQHDDDDDTRLLPPIAVIKSEPSSPPPPVARLLVTSGVKRFYPLPQNCHISCPQYKQNRKEWAASCIKELEALDLKVERTMIRDDGLVIDWSSPVPVWADTLKPNTCDLASVIVQTYEANDRARPPSRRHSSSRSQLPRSPATLHSSDALRDVSHVSSSLSSKLLPSASTPGSTETRINHSPTREKLPVPPRLSSIHRTLSPQTSGQSSSLPTKSTPTHSPSRRPRSPTRSVDVDSLPSKCKRSPVPVLSSSTTDPGPSTVPDGVQTSRHHHTLQEPQQSVVPAGYASSTDQEVSEMTLDYIRRYVQTYEADRASLASAYSRLATFAYRKHKQTSGLPQTVASISQASVGDISCSALKRGRLDVITELVALPSLHCAIPPSERRSTCTSGRRSKTRGLRHALPSAPSWVCWWCAELL
ncbi:hypothetical protein EDC04DRAFT_1611997 [Pisolithus marmoratus]|nr:hypothetical protein EDC04DRAFT_1611997 [Pisolithus marmoratus]